MRNVDVNAESLKLKAESSFVCLILASLVFMIACSKEGKSRDPKFVQYYNQGQLLYEKHCANCHQKNGKGLGRVYPPLDSSDFLDKNFNAVLCLMRNGIKGSIVVNGKDFNQPMPGIPTLTDLEIAEIATYVYNTWENDRGIVEVKDVSVAMDSCE